MKNGRTAIGMALVAMGALVQVASAQPLPSYRELKPIEDEPRKLRVAPVLLSRFPTTFSTALSADRKQMRSLDINGKVWQWSLERLAEPTLVTETNCEPACGVLSQDSRWLAFAEPGGAVVLWDFDSRQVHFRDATRSERTVTLAFAPDSRFLAAVTVNGNVRVWNVGDGALIRELVTKQSPVQTVAFSPDANELAIASFSQEVQFHEVRPANRPQAALGSRTIRAGKARITSLAFSPDGKQIVIATSDGAIDVYERSTGRKSTELGTYPFAIWTMAFEPGGQCLLAGSWDGTIKLWNAQSWKLLQSVKVHEESVASLNFDRELGAISAGLDGRLLYWGTEVPSIKATGMIAGRADSVWVTAYSPDGTKLFVGGRDKRFELWNVENKSLLVSRAGHPTTRCAAFSPDGKTLATGGDDGMVYLCDSETGETKSILQRHRGSVSAVIFCDEGKTLVSVCDGKEVKLWDATTGREKAKWNEHRQQIYCANISPDGRWLVTGGGNWTTGDPGELIVWEFKNGRVRARVEGHKLAVWSIVFTRDGSRFASSDSSGAVMVWNVETLKNEHILQHSMWVRALALSPNGRTLAVGRGDGSVRLWDTTTWTEKAACEGHESFAFALQFAPDGKTLASSGNDGIVCFWKNGL